MSKKLTKVELEKLVEELNAIIKNADIENRKLAEKNTTLSKENAQLKADIKDSKIELNKTKEKLEINKTARQADAENVKNVEVLSAALSKENDGLKEINNKLVAENKDMKKQLKDKDIEIEIFMAARAEDKKKVNNAEVIIETFKTKEQSLLDTSKQREEELYAFYKTEIMKLQSTLTEQNETLANLFEMMDNSMQQQQFLYNKYRGVFVKEQELFKGGDE